MVDQGGPSSHDQSSISMRHDQLSRLVITCNLAGEECDHHRTEEEDANAVHQHGWQAYHLH